MTRQPPAPQCVTYKSNSSRYGSSTRHGLRRASQIIRRHRQNHQRIRAAEKSRRPPAATSDSARSTPKKRRRSTSTPPSSATGASAATSAATSSSSSWKSSASASLKRSSSLAERHGIPMPKRDYSDPDSKLRGALMEMHEIAARVFQSNLKVPPARRRANIWPDATSRPSKPPSSASGSRKRRATSCRGNSNRASRPNN